MLCEAFAFDLPSVVKLVDATLEDGVYRPRPGSAGPAGPALWWMTAGSGSYLLSNGVNVELTVPAVGHPRGPSGGPISEAVLRREIVLDDEFVLDVLTATDLGSQHLLILDGDEDQCHVAVTTLRRTRASDNRSVGPQRGTAASRPFMLNERAAREWLSFASLAQELGELDCAMGADELPAIGPAWEPSDPLDVTDLLRQAQREPGILRHPPGVGLGFEMSGTGEYRFLVDITKPVALTLASPSRPVRELAGGAKGVDSALRVLCMAVEEGNQLLGDLGDYGSAAR